MHRIHSPLRRTLVWTGGIFLAAVVIAGGGAALRLRAVAADLRDAQEALDQVRADVEQGRLAAARERLAEVEQTLTDANAVVYNSMEVQLVEWLPVVRENLGAIRRSMGVAMTLVEGGRQILQSAQPLEDAEGNIEVPLTDGAIPLDAVAASQRAVSTMAISLPGRQEQPDSGLLLGPVADLQRKIYDEAARRRTQLDAVDRGLKILQDMSGANGARRYLIAVANTAEMRGSGGMILSYGVLVAQDGDFELGEFGPIDELFVEEPLPGDKVPSLPADYVNRWNAGADGGFQVTKLWRNANAAADFTMIAPVLTELFTQDTGLAVNGVIQIDPAGLAAILEGTGPVSVPGLGRVTADNVVALTLNEAYTRFPDRDVRQEVLGDVAEEVFEVLVEGEYDSLRPLGEALFDTAAERHIVFWTDKQQVEGDVRFFGADGSLPPAETVDYFHLTVQNVSANKLDYYLDTSLEVAGTRAGGRPGELTATITLANTAPVGGVSEYIFGPYDPSQVAGLYRGIVSLYVPQGTTIVSSAGEMLDDRARIVTEGGRTVIAFGADVQWGESRQIELVLRLAPRRAGPYAVTFVPSPRVRPTVVAARIDAGDGTVDGTTELRRTLVLRATPSAP